VVLRLWVRPQAMGLQYLLPALGCLWAVAYFWKRRHRWDWLKDGSLLMLVSILSAPYCWLFDQAVAISALLDGAYRTRSRVALALLAAASFLIDVGLVAGVKLPSALYLWTAPAWLGWYLLALRDSRLPESSDAGCQSISPFVV
jgi:hypothetical protein